MDEFRTDLELIKESLEGTGLSCEALQDLISQVHIFAFCLASLDIRQESTRHSDALDELSRYLQLPVPYGEMDEEQRVEWLLTELQTRRPLLPPAARWSAATAETFAVFRMLQRLQQEFGRRICRTYVISMSHTVSDLLEVLLLAKEAGLVDPMAQTVRPAGDPPVRNGGRPAGGPGGDGTAVQPIPSTASCCSATARATSPCRR